MHMNDFECFIIIPSFPFLIFHAYYNSPFLTTNLEI